MNHARSDSSKTKIILASASPRRRELLSLLGVEFSVVVPHVDESPLSGESPPQLAMRLSRRKAGAVASDYPEALVIGADTLVVLDGKVLGKPAHRAEAVEMLNNLRGREHLVYTGLALIQGVEGRHCEQLAETAVHMRRYRAEEIRHYAATDGPLDKAGAYAIQDAEFDPVKLIEGCYANVVGLPLCHLYRILCAWGAGPPNHPSEACSSMGGLAPGPTGRCPTAKTLSV